jgi:hypothetical protein
VLAPVRDTDGQLRKERLSDLALVPVIAVKGVLELEVKIRLTGAFYSRGGSCNISRKVAGLAEVFGDQPDRFGSV